MERRNRANRRYPTASGPDPRSEFPVNVNDPEITYVASADVRSYRPNPPYHLVGDVACRFAESISKRNARYFATRREAEQAGFTRLCGRCKRRREAALRGGPPPPFHRQERHPRYSLACGGRGLLVMMVVGLLVISVMGVCLR